MSSRPVPSMQPLNAVVLCGRLSSAPLERQLPSGSMLWSLEVSTEVAEGTLSVPVAWFDPPNAPTFTLDGMQFFGRLGSDYEQMFARPLASLAGLRVLDCPSGPSSAPV